MPASRRSPPLTDDLDAVYAALLKFEPTGGGDTPESVNQALHEAVTKLEWNMAGNARRLLFLAGDAPPHMDYPSDVPCPVSCALAAKRGIVVNTLRCGSDPGARKHWSAIAELGSGEFVTLPADGGSRQVETPFDKEIVAVSGKLNETVIPYGDLISGRFVRPERRMPWLAPPSRWHPVRRGVPVPASRRRKTSPPIFRTTS